MRLDRLDLNLLLAFDVLMAERNVSAAARRLNLSQSALSGSLARLRDFFGDALLVQSGRNMILTPRAEQLTVPVRNALMLIRSTITTPTVFDPATSNRHFNIVATDYVHVVLVDALIREVARAAPGVTFHFLQPGNAAADLFVRGEVDASISVDTHLLAGHPVLRLFEDQPCVICWKDNPHVGRTLDAATFRRLGHVIADFGAGRPASTYETRLAQHGVQRHVAISVAAFSQMPAAVVGTERIAVMHRRHADFFAALMPLRILPLPFAFPPIRECVQWHVMRQHDQGLRWLLDRLVALGEALPPSRPVNGERVFRDSRLSLRSKLANTHAIRGD